MKSRPENTSPSVLKVRSGLPGLKLSGENYTEERIKERIAGRTPRRSQRQTVPNGISLIGDIQERNQARSTARAMKYKRPSSPNSQGSGADAQTISRKTTCSNTPILKRKVEECSSAPNDRTGKELKGVEARLREVQPLIKNISNYSASSPCMMPFRERKTSRASKQSTKPSL